MAVIRSILCEDERDTFEMQISFNLKARVIILR